MSYSEIVTNYPLAKQHPASYSIMCAAALIAKRILPTDATVEDANVYYNELGDCTECLANHVCAVCVINE